MTLLIIWIACLIFNIQQAKELREPVLLWTILSIFFGPLSLIGHLIIKKLCY